MFQRALEDLDWRDPNERGEQLELIRAALLRLVQHEVVYYYRARRWSSARSNALRILAWCLASAGALAPLLAAAYPPWKVVSSFGYVALGLAGAFLLANQLFGGTTAHVRYITAQLALEQRIIAFQIEWEALRAGTEATARTEQAFDLLHQFGLDASDIVRRETAQWGDAVQAAIEAMRNTMKSGS